MRKALIAIGIVVALLVFSGAAQAAPHLKVDTDKKSYAIGEDVVITATNGWNDDIVTGYGYTITTPNGEVVWDGIFIEIAVLLHPGVSLEYTWDQTYLNSPLGTDYEQVEAGHYVAHDRTGGRAHFWVQDDVVDVPFYTVDQGQYSYYGYGTITESTYMVIRDDAAWSDFWAIHKSGIFPTPPKPEIDFCTEMVIVAIHGSYATSGAGIAIESVFDYGDHWETNVVKAYTPGILPVVTNPYHIVKTAYTDLPVEFSETVVYY